MRLFVVLGITLLAPGLAVGQSRDRVAEQEIEKLEHAYNAGRLANDIAGLNAMTTADYFAIGARGTTREVGNERTEPVNMTPSGRMEKSELRNMRIRVYGDSAVSTYEHYVGARQADGSNVDVKVVSTHVWVRQEGRWKLALMHSTYL